MNIIKELSIQLIHYSFKFHEHLSIAHAETVSQQTKGGMVLTLMIGPVSLQWQLDEVDPRAGEFLAAYESYSGATAGQMVIEAHIASPKTNNGPPELPNSFIRYRRIQGRDFVLGDDLITGHLSAQDHIECTIHPVLLHGTGLRVLEQFMYLLFYHAVQITTGHQPGGPFLLHSSGVLHEGAVHIFCGPAGSGKSTAAALCPVRPMLSDEALAITQNQAGSDGLGSSAGSNDPSGTTACQVSGTPINPFCFQIVYRFWCCRNLGISMAIYKNKLPLFINF